MIEIKVSLLNILDIILKILKDYILSKYNHNLYIFLNN
jgi:hypothetical protein